MAFKGVLSVVFVCLFGLGSTTSCADLRDCLWSNENCCSDSVCRETCNYCYYNHQCGTGEECCTDGSCRSFCPFSCTYDYQCDIGEGCCGGGECSSACWYGNDWSGGATAGAVVSTTGFFGCSDGYQCDVGEECCGDGECSSACTNDSSGGSTAGAVVGTIGFIVFIILFASCRYCAYSPYYRYRTSAAVIVAKQPGYQPFVSTVSTTESSQMQQYPPPGNNQPPPGYNQPPPANTSYPQYPAPQGQAQVSMPPPVSAGQPVGKNQFVQ